MANVSKPSPPEFLRENCILEKELRKKKKRKKKEEKKQMAEKSLARIRKKNTSNV
jgi:dsRNA-specific ribonuclease